MGLQAGKMNFTKVLQCNALFRISGFLILWGPAYKSYKIPPFNCVIQEPVTKYLIFKIICFHFIWKASERAPKGKCKRSSFSKLIAQMPPQLGLRQAQFGVRSQKLPVDANVGGKGIKYLSRNLLPSRICTSQVAGIRSGAGTRTWIVWYRMQMSQEVSQSFCQTPKTKVLPKFSVTLLLFQWLEFSLPHCRGCHTTINGTVTIQTRKVKTNGLFQRKANH